MAIITKEDIGKKFIVNQELCELIGLCDEPTVMFKKKDGSTMTLGKHSRIVKASVMLRPPEENWRNKIREAIAKLPDYWDESGTEAKEYLEERLGL